MLSRLRQETHERHALIERDLDLLRPDLTLRDHRDLLVRFYGFYQPWETRAVAGPSGLPGAVFAGRLKVPLLERDLAHLGVTDAALSELPRCATLPDVSSVARAMGSAYVLEGATLGGQLISRHLERVLGLAGGAGYSFYRGYGPGTAAMWRSFGEALETHVPPDHHDAAVAAACATFDALQGWTCGQQTT